MAGLLAASRSESPGRSESSDMIAAAASSEFGSASAPAPSAQRIVVAVRKRPRIGPVEMAEADVVSVKEASGTVEISEPKISVDGRRVIDQRGTYNFDYAFDESASNARIYMQAVRPVLDVTRRGGNAVFFAYGQTGSGKTHTMMGSADGTEHGLYALAAQDIIAQLRGMRLSVAFYEIYSGKLFDLLNGRSPIQTLEDEHKNLHLVGLTEHPVSDHSALLELMKMGAAQRSSGSTHVNERSSRSHAVLVFFVKPRREPRIFSRVSFIDLAGSERAADTLDLDKKTRAEGAEINRSLLALKECVRGMHERKRHIPFRGSKLTQVLRDSFQGNCVTVMIANVSPCLVHCDDTMNTLKYTDRIKEMPSEAQRLTAVNGSAASPTTGQSVEPDLCSKCGFPILLDDKSLHVCPKQYVPCKFCKMEIVKSKLQRHHQECLEVPVACPDCGLRATRGQMYQHPDKCPSATFTCNQCHQKVPRRQRDTHAITDCPEAKRPCAFCRAPVKRKDHAEHVAACPQRQVPCPACGGLVKQALLKEHSRTCFSASIQRRTPALAAMATTPSRLPPIRRESSLSGAASNTPRRALASQAAFETASDTASNADHAFPATARPLASSSSAAAAQLPTAGASPQTARRPAKASRSSADAKPDRRRASDVAALDVRQLQIPDAGVAAAAVPRSVTPTQPAVAAPVAATAAGAATKTPKPAAKSSLGRKPIPPAALEPPAPGADKDAPTTTTTTTDSAASVSALANSAPPAAKASKPGAATTTGTRKPKPRAGPPPGASEAEAPPRVPSPPEGERGPSRPTASPPVAVESSRTTGICRGCGGTNGRPHANGCSEEIVPCPFAESGCTSVVRRGELEAHVTANLGQHLLLVHSQSLDLRRENATLREKLTAVERQVATGTTQSSGGSGGNRTPSRLFEGTIDTRRSPPSAMMEEPSPPPTGPRTPPAKREARVLPLSEKPIAARAGPRSSRR